MAEGWVKGFWDAASDPDEWAGAAKSVLEGVRYIATGHEPSYFPDSLSERAQKARTPTQARAVIDDLIGHHSTDRRLLSSINYMAGLSDMWSSAVETAYGPTAPFTANGQGLLASGGAREVAKYSTPYVVSQTMLDRMFKNNPRAQLLYLKQESPMELLPALVEQDESKLRGGKKWYSFVTDSVGRIVTAPWEGIKYLGRVSDRIEEMMGWSWYNDISDPYLRRTMSTRFFDYQLNPWDFTLTHETEAKSKVDQIEASGITGERAVAELEAYFSQNQLGAAGIFGDMFGKVLYDPLNLIPGTWIAKGAGKTARLASVPLLGKAALGVERAGLLLRGLGPRGRSLLPNFSIEQILKMDESTYAYHVAQTPPKGLTRALFETDPYNLADEARRQIMIRMGAYNDVVFNVDNPAALTDIAKSLSTGKVTGWVEQNMPDFLEQPAIARFAASVRGKPWLERQLKKMYKSKGWTQLSLTPPEILEEARVARGLATTDDVLKQNYNTVLRAAFEGSIHDAMFQAQRELFEQTSHGAFLMQRVRPVVQGMRQAVSFVTVNNPAFVFLNTVNNFATYMWSAARNPIRAPRIAAQSLALELGSALPQGGKYPAYFDNLLKAVDQTPETVETYISRSSSLHDLLGNSGIQGLDQLSPTQITQKISQSLTQPVKQTFSKGRISDKLFGFVYGASRIDQAFRRATYLNSLASMTSWGTTPSWVANTLGPNLFDELVKAGHPEDVARRAEGVVLDATKSFFNGDEALALGEDAETALSRVITTRLEEAFGGAAHGAWSATDLADSYLVSKGFTEPQARQAMLRDMENAINQTSDILRKVTKDDDVESVVEQIRAIPHPWYTEHELAAALSNVPPLTRGPSTRLKRLAITSDSLKEDMLDSSLIFNQVLESAVYRGRRAWMKPITTPLGRMTPAEFYSRTVHESIKSQAARLAEINQLHYQAAKNGQAALGASSRVAPDLTLNELRKAVSKGDIAEVQQVVRQAVAGGRSVTRKVWTALTEADRKLADLKVPATDSARQALQEVRQSIIDGPQAAWMPPRKNVVMAKYESQARAGQVGKLDDLKVRFHGSGHLGQEVTDRPGRVARLYYYAVDPKKNADFKPAKFFLPQSPYRVEGRFAIAGVEDIRNVLTKYKIDPADADAWETALVAEGYHGYRMPDIDLKGRVDTIAMFYDVVPDKVNQALVDDVIKLTRKNGGLTISISGATPPSNTELYMVGAYPSQTVTVALEDLKPAVVRKFANSNRDLLRRPNHYIGTWVHDAGDGRQVVDLDVSMGIASQDEALQTGARASQQSIYRMDTGKVINIPPKMRQAMGTETTQAELWNDYFNLKRTSIDERAAAVDWLMKRRKTPQWMVDALEKWRVAERQVTDIHQEAIQRALANGGTTEAWEEADRIITTAYEKARKNRGNLFRITPSDRPSAEEFMHGAGVQAKTEEEFAEHVITRLRDEWGPFTRGEIDFSFDVRNAINNSVSTVVKNYRPWRDQITAQASAMTDFVMLNYNQQYGFDRALQTFMPFVFWPSRSAVNWGIRAARAPGAFYALAQVLTQPEEYAANYGLPTRLQFQIPIYLPWADEFLNKVPIARDLMSSGNYGSVYFVDPMRFIFPFQDYRQQFEDERKRGTPMGLALDWVETNTPVSVNPFIKVVGRQLGLLDKDAWQGISMTGNPVLVPLTLASQSAARWLYAGDASAIPEDEQSGYANRGHFSIPFLSDILGLDNARFAEYRAERAVWSLAASGDLLPGAPKDEQIDAAWTALETHQGPAWKNAVKASNSERFLKQLTSYIGFPVGPVTPVQEGEQLWYSLRGAYSQAARTGNLDSFYKRYPEFRLRSAVVKGLDDPEGKEKMVETELYYRDVENFVDAPFKMQLDEINRTLDTLRRQTQTESVREQIAIVEGQRDIIKEQQDERRGLLDYAYPNRETELSLGRPPLDRALATARSAYYSIERGPGESYEEFQLRQEQFLQQFPDDGVESIDWQESYKQFLLVNLDYGSRVSAAANRKDFDLVDALHEEREAVLTELHSQWQQGLDRSTVENYIESFARNKTPQEIEFDQAQALFDTWMSLVASGSPFSSRQKGAISEYFRSLPEIQKHYPLRSMDITNLSYDARVALLRRREIWSQYYDLNDPELQLSYMQMNLAELNMINSLFGMPETGVLDIPTAPIESRMGDRSRERLKMILAHRREVELQRQSPEPLDPDQLRDYSGVLAASYDDPTPMTGQDVDFYAELFGGSP